MVPDRSAKRDWRHVAAAGLAFALLGSVAVYGQDGPKGNGQNPKQPKPAITAPAIPNAPSSYPWPYSCDRPKSSEQDNLCIERESAYQAKRSADWTRNTFIVGVIGTMGVVLSLFFTAVATKAAQRSARAAEEAVSVLPLLERAHVYPEILSGGDFNLLIKTARDFFSEDFDKDDSVTPGMANSVFQFRNVGKTPAILRQAFASVGIIPLPWEVGLPIPKAILGEGDDSGAFVAKMEMGLTPKQARQVSSHTARLCLSGMVTFDDIWGVQHTTKFLFRWDMEIGKFVLADLKTEETQYDV